MFCSDDDKEDDDEGVNYSGHHAEDGITPMVLMMRKRDEKDDIHNGDDNNNEDVNDDHDDNYTGNEFNKVQACSLNQATTQSPPEACLVAILGHATRSSSLKLAIPTQHIAISTSLRTTWRTFCSHLLKRCSFKVRPYSGKQWLTK